MRTRVILIYLMLSRSWFNLIQTHRTLHTALLSLFFVYAGRELYVYVSYSHTESNSTPKNNTVNKHLKRAFSMNFKVISRVRTCCPRS